MEATLNALPPPFLVNCFKALTALNKYQYFFSSFSGKLCLQNEDLAKQCIAALARELETSSDPAIRNNVTVVMCDLCVRSVLLSAGG